MSKKPPASSFLSLLDNAPWKREDVKEEYEVFTRTLNEFMNSRKTPILITSVIDGEQVNFHLLFTLVVSGGGLWRMTKHKLWKRLAQKMGFWSPTAYLHLMRIYIKHLYSFERFYIFKHADNGKDYRKIFKSIKKKPQENVEEELYITPPISPQEHSDDRIDIEDKTNINLNEKNSNLYNETVDNSEMIQDSSLKPEADISGQSNGEKFHHISMNDRNDATKIKVENLDFSKQNNFYITEISEKYDRPKSSQRGDNFNIGLGIDTQNFDIDTDHLKSSNYSTSVDNSKYNFDNMRGARRVGHICYDMRPKSLQYAPQDYTKSPLPVFSRRLLARNREGLLMHRVERELRGSNAMGYTAALKVLTLKSLDKTFNITLYPPVLEALLSCYQKLKGKISLQQFEDTNLFNIDSVHESNLSYLTKISAIFRNLSSAPQNLNIMKIHLIIVQFLCDMLSLDSFKNNFENRKSLEVVRGGITTRSWDSSKILIFGNMNHTDSQFEEIWLNAAEALCNIVHNLKLSAVEESDCNIYMDQYNFPLEVSPERLNKLSNFGKCLMQCLPQLISTACSLTQPERSVFMSIEILAKLAVNPNSKPMWLSLKSDIVLQLMVRMLERTIQNDYISEWAIFLAYYLALHGLCLQIVKNLLLRKDVIRNLVLLIQAESWDPIEGLDKETLNHRRHSMTLKAASILAKLISYAPSSKSILDKYESILVDVFLNATEDVSKSLKMILTLL